MKIFTEHVLHNMSLKTRHVVGVIMVLFGAMTPMFSTPANAAPILYVAAYDATLDPNALNPFASSTGPAIGPTILAINGLGYTASVELSTSNFPGGGVGAIQSTFINTAVGFNSAALNAGNSLGIFAAVLDSDPGVGPRSLLAGTSIAALAYSQWTAPAGPGYTQQADTSTTHILGAGTQGSAQTTTIVLRPVPGGTTTTNSSGVVALSPNSESSNEATFNGLIPTYALIQKLVISPPNSGALFTVGASSSIAAVPIPAAMFFVVPALAAVFGFGRKKSGYTMA
jgi:hypothetical protein